MAQTTSGKSARNVYVEFSTNGSSWTDCSGWANEIKWDGGERDTGNTKTFDGDTPVHTRGKLNESSIVLTAIYTESASEVARLAHAAWKAGTDFYLRFTPLGNTTGNIRYTSSAGTVKNPVVPTEIKADSADALVVEITLECASIADAAIP